LTSHNKLRHPITVRAAAGAVFGITNRFTQIQHLLRAGPVSDPVVRQPGPPTPTGTAAPPRYSGPDETQAYAKISKALFALRGTSVYPDATFTLRLSFGVVSGYEEGGQAVPCWTTMSGAFDHESKHNGMDPWCLPESWHSSGQSIPGNVPLNFICTADIIGGNSGSPVVNKNLELVGIIFDGNIQSLTGDFYYSEHQARAIGVHSEAIRQALSTIYAAPALAGQLGK
jgi:hypothetical protein